jgi:hypothetical protein
VCVCVCVCVLGVRCAYCTSRLRPIMQSFSGCPAPALPACLLSLCLFDEDAACKQIQRSRSHHSYVSRYNDTEATLQTVLILNVPALAEYCKRKTSTRAGNTDMQNPTRHVLFAFSRAQIRKFQSSYYSYIYSFSRTQWKYFSIDGILIS